MSYMGHLPMPPAERRAQLTAALDELDLPADVFGPMELVAELGPDHVGRYEMVFAQLRAALRNVGAGIGRSAAAARSRRTGQARCAATSSGAALDRAFDEVMALPHLIAHLAKGRRATASSPSHAISPAARVGTGEPFCRGQPVSLANARRPISQGLHRALAQCAGPRRMPSFPGRVYPWLMR